MVRAGTEVRSFEEQLEVGNRASDEPTLRSFYEAFFRGKQVDWQASLSVPGKALSQKWGVDRILSLVNETGSEVVRVDEKKQEKPYTGIFLEDHHEWRKSLRDGAATWTSPGWMNKNLCIDYLLYWVTACDTAYLIDWDKLRLAWTTHREEWIARAKAPGSDFRWCSSPNEEYTTFGVVVPVRVLFDATGGFMKRRIPGTTLPTHL